MHLLVIRHAIAEARAPHEDDASRPLTSHGRREFKSVVRGLRRLGWRLDHVLTSPWQRAKHTAKLLAPIRSADPVETDLLVQTPNADLISLIASSSGLAKKRRAVAIVGHEPWLGELVAWLAFGDTRYHHALVLKKAGVVWLDGTATPGGMMLRAQLPPRVLRSI